MAHPDLPSFIRSVGVEESARLFGQTPRAIRAWRDRERTPRPVTARKIVEKSKRHPEGPVTLAGIYGANQ